MTDTNKIVQGYKGKRLAKPPAAAAHLQTTPNRLAKLRLTGDSPPFYRLGRSILYDLDEIDAWLDKRRRISTSEHGGEHVRAS